MTGKYAYAYTTYLDAEKSTKTSLTLNSIKATGHGRKCILMCWGAVKVTTLTARLSVYVNGKDSCSGITSSTSYVPVFDSNIITLPEGENTIEIRLSAQANTATASNASPIAAPIRTSNIVSLMILCHFVLGPLLFMLVLPSTA